MAGDSSLPAAPPSNPGFPANPLPIIFDGFEGLNTKPSRPGIEDQELYWCDNYMPLGKRNLRTMWGVGTSIYTVAGGLTVIFMSFVNVNSVPVCLAFISDGSIIQINTSTSAVTTVGPAGTILNPSPSTIGVSQWGSQYVIIVSSQTNGYFIWDGTVLYHPGTLAPIVTITNGGSGYTSNPTVAASGGSGSGATFSVTLVNAIVTTITITNPGSGYKVGETVTLGITGGGGASATATVTIMPFGIKGTTVETFQSRVWVANGSLVYFTAPSSVSDFGTANGGGQFTSNDSFLRVGFQSLKQSNGFMYLLADSSMNYVSNVVTQGTPATTTFTNQNVDPQIGTPWANSVQVFSRNIVFANSFGIHVSYGGAVTKVSPQLDGIYTSVPNFGGFNPSSAVAVVFGIHVYMLLLPIVDLISGQKVNKLLMWDGQKWWTAQQELNLTFIATQEIDSQMTAWGTDGKVIAPLFQNPSSSLEKIIQSKLWDTPGYYIDKLTKRFYCLINYYLPDSSQVNISIDNELGASQSNTTISPRVMSWTNNSGGAISWTNLSGVPIIWTASGLSYFYFSIGQPGVLIGTTVSTVAQDISIVSMTILEQLFQTNV